MKTLEISINPDELEQDVEQLTMLKGIGFAHVSLAESIWKDQHGDLEDPSLFGFSEKSKGDKGLSRRLWKAFKDEWFELACSNTSKYDRLRKQVADLKGAPATVIVSSISAGIAACLGITAGIIAPFVAIFLHGVLTVGNNVVCGAIVEERGGTNAAGSGTAQKTPDSGHQS
jgi:hypothetical protein